MKKVLFALLIASVFALSGCATTKPVGMLYTKVQMPVTATGQSGAATKVGVATCKSYLGLIALGNCSIEAAMENGNISQVHSVDWKAKNILGILGTYKVIVHGK